jgi:predicted DNA-binding antitoxin AbrB/MazE fold protein
MTTRLKAHYDGRVLVPEQPVDLPVGRRLEIQVAAAPDERPQRPGLLKDLAELARTLPGNPAGPTDGAAQHDHYLYGTPKRA